MSKDKVTIALGLFFYVLSEILIENLFLKLSKKMSHGLSRELFGEPNLNPVAFAFISDGRAKPVHELV